MILTKEIANKYSMPPEARVFLKKHYPNGENLIKVIEGAKEKNFNLATTIAFWAENFVPLDKKDKEQLSELLNNKDVTHYYNCYDVQRSQDVIDSHSVSDSEGILYSDNIRNSIMCSNSSNCEESIAIFYSQFCNNSKKIIHSQTCKNSENIIKSTMCLDSSDLFNCNNIISCGHLTNCDRTKNSYFSSWCNKLNFSFFCSLTQGDFLLFNEPYDKDLYEMILEQYKSLVRPLEFVKNWPTKNNLFDEPTFTTNYKKFFVAQQDKFWEWVKTLPNYNPKILYEITCLPQFLS